MVSCELYLGAKDFLPGKPESFFEIGYLLWKRASIFVICSIMTVNSFGIMLIYLILFGDTMSSVMRSILGIDDTHLFG